MGGDKIVLLDGAGANGGGAATNGLLSMIPGMFANLIGGNKMDPNLVAALMNGRNNQDGFGGANGWWLWIIVLFWLWGGRGFGNGFGNGGDCCANGLPAQLNNDYGRELLMQAIQGNRSAIDQIASALNCSTTQLQNAICNVQGAIDKVAGQVGMTSQAVINAVQQQGCEIGNQISSCCCNLSSIGSLYEMVTKNVIVSTTNTVFGINPRAWIALPCEGLILLKIRQVVPTAGSALPVQIAVPANSTVSTVGADTCCPVTGVNVVNPINVAVTGAAMVNGTERLLYFNKVRGVLRLMDCCVPTTTAQASEVKAGK